MADQYLIAYIAGIIDADGWVGLTNTGGKILTIKIGVGMTDFQIPLMLKELYGGNLVTRENEGTNKKPLLLWTVKAKQAEKVLLDVLPYLRIKYNQAKLLLTYRQKMVGTKGLKVTQEKIDDMNVMKLELNQLNQRGRALA